MKTDQLIGALANGLEAVDPQVSRKRLAAGAMLGVVLAVPLMLGLLGVNPALEAAASMPMFWVKLAFVAIIAASGWRIVRCLAQPGATPYRAAFVLAVPVLGMATLALFVLAAAAPDTRVGLLLGSSWKACPFNIAMLAAPALVLLLFAVRSLAPTRLRLAGAGTGLFAGALGALVYVLHCPELEAPFLAVWYVLGLLIPTAVGAVLAPWVLRW
jgi:hypothetical protein